MDGHNDKDAMVNLINPIYKNTVHIGVGGKKTHALLDSGASISCVSKEFLSKTTFFGRKLEQSDYLNIVGVGQHKIPVLGKIKLPISFQNATIDTYFNVVEKLPHSMILGHDFLKINKIVVDFHTNTMRTSDDESVCTITTKAGFARLALPVTIPAKHEMDVPVKVSRTKSNTVVLLEPTLSANYSFAVAKCVVTVLNGKSTIKILNPTNQDIDIKSNTLLAIVSQVDEASIQCISTPPQTSAEKTESIESNSDKIDFDLDNSDLTDQQKQHF